MENKGSNNRDLISCSEDRPLLIVGGGLSGLILSLQCEERQIPYRLILRADSNQSSLAAAGIFNPVVFKRMNLSWKADKLIPYLVEFYRKWEARTDSSFLHETQILKPISEYDKARFWKKRSIEETGDFTYHEPEEPLQHIINTVGTGRVARCGWLDTKVFINSAQEYISRNILKDHEFNVREEFDNNVNKEYYSKDAHIVLAEGWHAAKNPLWNYLPWKPAKGEVLTIEIMDTDVKEYIKGLGAIISREIFIVPLADGRFKIGSNYEWEFIDAAPSAKGMQDLLAKFELLIPKIDYVVIDHKSGVRPTVADRRPFIGRHPVLKQFSIFNGMGSKGVMLVPYFSDHLLDYLLVGSKLDPEIDIARFNKRFKRSYESGGAHFASS